MVKELYQTTLREVSLNVTSGEIDSLRKKNITKSGCRVYDGGHVGIAGTLGQPTEETWKHARANLSRKLSCPWGPETGKTRQVSLGKSMDAEAFLARAEKLMATLRQDFPQFVFSNKLNWMEEEWRLHNDAGLDYRWQDAGAIISLLVRAQDSVNIFDTGLEAVYRDFDPEALLTGFREILEAHLNPIPLPDAEKLPVITSGGLYLFSRAWEEGLNGQKLARNASPWSGKVGQKLFSENFTLRADRTAENLLTPFFDVEGSTLPEDTLPFIENGVLRRGYADKKCAHDHGGDVTAAASGSYDDMPALSAPPLSVQPTGKTLEEILEGRPAIYCMVASGGDVTSDGSFASPVQMAYLYQNGRLVGRLPEFGIRGNLTELLGNGYLGCSTDRSYDSQRQCVMEMTIVR